MEVRGFKGCIFLTRNCSSHLPTCLPNDCCYPLLQVVYALLEPLVHKYLWDLRMPENGSGAMDRIQSLMVFVRLMTKENAEV